MLNILHISRYMKVESDGIDTVFNQLVKSQSKLQGVSVDSICTTGLVENIRHISKIKYSDIVIFHRMYDLNSIILMFFCYFFKHKYILFPHSGFTNSSQVKSKYKKKLFRICILNKLIKNSSSIHYLTDNEKSHSFPKKKSFVVPNGIDLHNFSENGKSEYKYISFLGRYDVNHKGIDLLLEAVYLNKKNFANNNIKLVMHGYFSSDKDEEILTGLISKYSIENEVVLNGPIFADKKLQFIGGSIAYILTSRYEGMPLSVLEALSLDKFCLISKGTNMEDLVVSNSWGLCSDCDVESISSMLSKFILSHDKYQNIKSSEYVKNNFSWQEISLRLVSNYHHLVENDEL